MSAARLIGTGFPSVVRHTFSGFSMRLMWLIPFNSGSHGCAFPFAEAGTIMTAEVFSCCRFLLR